MKKTVLLMLGLALMSGASTASAQTGADKDKGSKSATTIVRSMFASGYVGIRFDDETITRGGKTTSKVVITDVSEGSPAAKAGLRKGDEIVRINGLAATNGKFAAIARTLEEGDTVRLRVKRDDKERDYALVAAARPNQFVHVGPDHRTIIFSSDSVRELTKEWLKHAQVHIDSMKLPSIFFEHGDSSFNIRIDKFRGLGDTIIFRRDTAAIRKWREGFPPGSFERFEHIGPGAIIRSVEIGSRTIAGAEMTEFDPSMKNILGTDRGLLVVRVVPETPAAKAGLQAGDVIVKANDRAITNVSDLRDLMWMQPQSATTLKLEIVRKGENRTIEVSLRKRSED